MPSMELNLNVSSVEHTFDNYVSVPGVDPVYRAFKKFAEKREPCLILLHGGIGNGKTYMLEAVSIRLYEKNITARVVIWNKFVGLLKQALRNKDFFASYDSILDNHCNAGILLIDDYGMGTTDTPFEKSVLERLIDIRYYNRLPTALTTNMALSDLPERVISRFSDPEVGVIIENKGGDYRRRVK